MRILHRPPVSSRRGLALVELLLLLALLVQVLTLILPATQRVQTTASRLNAHPDWGPFSITIGNYGLLVNDLGVDTREAIRKSIQDGEIDISDYQDLDERYGDAIALGELLSMQIQACIDVETNSRVDRQLQESLEAVLQTLNALDEAYPYVQIISTGGE